MGQHDDRLPTLHSNSKLIQLLNSDYKLYLENLDKKYLRYYKYSGKIKRFQFHTKFFKFQKL